MLHKMLRLQNANLRQLYEFTRNILPQGLMVHLWLKIQADKTLPVPIYDSSCFVDRFPNPSIICGVDRVPQTYGVYIDICLWNVAKADELTSFLIELDKKEGFVAAPSDGNGKQMGAFCGIADHQYQAIRSYLVKDFDLVEKYPSYQYWIPMDKRKSLSDSNIKPPDGFYFDKLQFREAQFVNETWPFKFPGSQSRTEYRIKNFPDVALRVQNSGELAGFELIHDQHGYMNHLYILDAFRRRGLGTKIEEKLAQVLIKEYDIVTFKFVVDTNTKAKAMSDSSPWWQDFGYMGSYIEYTKHSAKK